MSALAFLIMLAALFVIVFNFQTVLTQSRRAVSYFAPFAPRLSYRASKRQAGQIQKVIVRKRGPTRYY
jgi:hypothetical protein